MLDLFGGGEPGPCEAQEKSLKRSTGGAPPPKKFEEVGGNIDQLVASPKNHFDLRNKQQAPSSAPTPTPKPKPKKGPGRYKRVSAMVKPPTEEALRAECCLVEAEDDPGRTDKWRPEWQPRLKPRGRRGWHANINAISLLESQIQVEKPDVIDWNSYRSPGDPIPWKVVEEDILKFVAAGGTVSAYCRASGLGYEVVRRYLFDNPDFKAKMAEAREVGADSLATEALAIASTPMLTEERITVYDKNNEVVTNSVKVADNTYARKLAFQARMQLLEKWAPNKYGPNAKAETSGGMAEKLRAARERIRTKLKEERRAARAVKSADAS